MVSKLFHFYFLLTYFLDMGWQQRGSMLAYNSFSGIGWLVGVLSKKVVDVGVMCKSCSTCEAAKRGKVPFEKHDCHVNHVGSSKAMEAACLGILLLRSVQKGYMVEFVCADDDSSCRAKAQLKTNGGVLPEGFLVPKFLADPSHRIKIFGKYVYKLKVLPLKTSPAQNQHAARIKKNWGYFIYTNRGKTLEEMQSLSMGPLLHMCNIHTKCNHTWCLKLRADKEGKKYYNPLDLDLKNQRDKKIHDD